MVGYKTYVRKRALGCLVVLFILYIFYCITWSFIFLILMQNY